MLVVNFFAGPGARKSTLAADVFAELKWAGVNAELVTEYAKEKVWEENLEILKDQKHVFDEQHARIKRVENKVDVVVCDSPVFNSLIYGELYNKTIDPEFRQEIIKAHYNYDSFNFFVVREAPYNPKGRIQTEEESKELDNIIKATLNANCIEYTLIPGDKTSTAIVANTILTALGIKKKVSEFPLASLEGEVICTQTQETKYDFGVLIPSGTEGKMYVPCEKVLRALQDRSATKRLLGRRVKIEFLD